MIPFLRSIWTPCSHSCLKLAWKVSSRSELWFPRKINLKGWWSMAAVSSFPQEYSAPWEPSLLPLLWVRFLQLLSRVGLLSQTSSCGHTLQDTLRPVAGRMSPALCNLRFQIVCVCWIVQHFYSCPAKAARVMTLQAAASRVHWKQMPPIKGVLGPVSFSLAQSPPPLPAPLLHRSLGEHRPATAYRGSAGQLHLQVENGPITIFKN